MDTGFPALIPEPAPQDSKKDGQQKKAHDVNGNYSVPLKEISQEET